MEKEKEGMERRGIKEERERGREERREGRKKQVEGDRKEGLRMEGEKKKRKKSTCFSNSC